MSELVTPGQPTIGVTVWERKKPERNPSVEVRLPDGLMMPAAAQLEHAVDLQDWIREGERQLEDESEVFRLFAAPIAISLMTGGIIAGLTGYTAGYSAMVAGVFVVLGDMASALWRFRVKRDRWRRMDAYRSRLRDLTIPRNT